MPCIADPATAALLAVQAMEAGAFFARAFPGSGWEWLFARMGARPRGTCDTLGEAAARALLAIRGGERG